MPADMTPKIPTAQHPATIAKKKKKKERCIKITIIFTNIFINKLY